MLTMRYHIAEISFSEDLTQPDSKVLPVGLLLLGEIQGLSFALLAMRKSVQVAHLPRIVQKLIADFPALMARQITELIKNKQDIDVMIECFEDSLRNSFFVSDLKTHLELDLGIKSSKNDAYA